MTTIGDSDGGTRKFTSAGIRVVTASGRWEATRQGVMVDAQPSMVRR